MINEINISTGTVGDKNFNGITIGAIAQSEITNNEIVIARVWNAMDKSNVTQISRLLNEAFYSNSV